MKIMEDHFDGVTFLDFFQSNEDKFRMFTKKYQKYMRGGRLEFSKCRAFY